MNRTIKLHQRVQAPSLDQAKPLQAAPLPATLPSIRRDRGPLVGRTLVQRLCDPALAAADPVHVLVGPPVCAPSESDDPRARHEAALPVVGLDVDLEHRRRGRREPAHAA